MKTKWLVAYVACLVAVSTLLYVRFEGWSLPDSLFFTVTVLCSGYGYLTPSTEAGRAWTAAVNILGVGAFGLLVHSERAHDLEVEKNKKPRRRMRIRTGLLGRRVDRLLWSKSSWWTVTKTPSKPGGTVFRPFTGTFGRGPRLEPPVSRRPGPWSYAPIRTR